MAAAAAVIVLLEAAAQSAGAGVRVVYVDPAAAGGAVAADGGKAPAAGVRAPGARAVDRGPAHRAQRSARTTDPVALTAAVGGRDVTVWLPYWAMTAAYDSATAHANLVGTASPFWYEIDGVRTVVPNSGAGDPGIIDGLRAAGIAVVPTVTENAGLRAFDATLASPRRRAAMVRAVVSIASTPGYDGLDLDFEQFALDPEHSAALVDQAAALYPTFVGQVCADLRRLGKSCSVTVMPQTSGPLWRGKLATSVYDYAALAKVAGHVQIMAYDEHAPGTAPGPVAGFPWVRQVVDYARSVMPPGKAELGLAAYGYDFSAGSASSITAVQAEQLAATRGATAKWNANQQEEEIIYGPRRHRHTVWFENARAEYARAALARQAGFAGVALWYAGGEDPSVWGMLGGRG